MGVLLLLGIGLAQESWAQNLFGYSLAPVSPKGRDVALVVSDPTYKGKTETQTGIAWLVDPVNLHIIGQFVAAPGESWFGDTMASTFRGKVNGPQLLAVSARDSGISVVGLYDVQTMLRIRTILTTVEAPCRTSICFCSMPGTSASALIIGTPTHTSKTKMEGVVQAYSLEDGRLIWEHTGGEADARFGTAVCGIGDNDQDGIEDVCASSTPIHDLGKPNSPRGGSVTVLSGKDGHMIRKINAPDHDAMFGSQLISRFDWNEDGKMDVLVAQSYTTLPRVYVFDLATASLIEAWHSDQNPSYGACLGVLYGAKSNGASRLIVGSPGPVPFRDSPILIYSRQEPFVKRVVGDGNNESWFGVAFALLSDLDTDGTPDFAVGAATARGWETCPGAVYLLSGVEARVIKKIRSEDCIRQPLAK